MIMTMMLKKETSDGIVTVSPMVASTRDGEEDDDGESRGEDVEQDAPVEIKSKDCIYWITRAYLLFLQLRRSCQSEKSKKKRASFESVFGSDIEGELELEETFTSVKPEAIEKYMQMTKFTRKELQAMYRGFKQDCPQGVIKEETFKEIYAHFFPRGSETDAYASYVYNSIERSGPSVTFTDLVLMMSTLARGSPEEKLRWAFRLYDVDRDGVLSREEIYRVVLSIYDLLGKKTASMYEKTAIDQADQVFERLDLNGDGVITVTEFITSCMRDQRIRDSLDKCDTVF